jgi:hypothetical protein
LHIARTRFRVSITPVAKKVNKDVWNADFFGNPEEAIEVFILGVL